MLEATPVKEVRDLILHLVTSIVDDPKDIRVVDEQGEQTVVYKVYAPKEEVGKIIGREGRMAAALRTILYSYCSKRGFRAVLEIAE